MEASDAFIEACNNGEVKKIKKLLDSKQFIANCFVNYEDTEVLPITVAIIKGQNDVVKLLLNYMPNDGVRYCEMKNAFHMAIEHANSKALKMLLRKFGTDDHTLHIFCVMSLNHAITIYINELRNGKDDSIGTLERMIARLFKKGSKIQRIIEDHRVYFKLCYAILDNNPVRVQRILSTVEDTNFISLRIRCPVRILYRPLNVAVIFKREEIVKTILNICANPSEAIDTALNVYNFEMAISHLGRIRDRSSRNIKAFLILKRAIKYGSLDHIKIMLDRGYRLAMIDYVKNSTFSRSPYSIMEFLLNYDKDVKLDYSESEDVFQECLFLECFKSGSIPVLLMQRNFDSGIANGLPNKLKAFPMLDDLDAGQYHYSKGCKICHLKNYFLKMGLIDKEYVVVRAWVIKDAERNSYFVNDHNSENIVFKRLFKEEFERMKNTQLSQGTSFARGITLLDFIYIEPNRVARYVRNVNLLEIYKENERDFCNSFPEYGFLLNQRFRKGFKRRNLLDAADDLLTKALGQRLTQDMLENIFQYFNNDKLEKFIN